MGRKKLIVCNLNFDDNETIEEKVSKMFAPENLISCFSEKNYEVYKKAIQHANIQMVLNDEELMNTINAFFASGLNTSLTSEMIRLKSSRGLTSRTLTMPLCLKTL